MFNVSKKIIKIITIIALITNLLFVCGCGQQEQAISNNIIERKENWKNNLYVPTQINKVNNTYFIVDCFHNRVIYNNNLTDDISKWKTMTDKSNRGHTIASDGQVYLHDDTDNSSIKVFVKENDDFKQTQSINNITGRPHYIVYDEQTKYFYALCSQEGKIVILKNNLGTVEIIKSIDINEIKNTYVRSFNIIDGYIYLVSGGGYINKIKCDDMSFKVVERYEVSKDLYGMDGIIKIGDYYYISIMQNDKGDIIPKFIRTKSLNGLINDEYEDIYNKFGLKDKPYFITHFDNHYYITEVGEINNSIKQFDVEDNEIKNIKNIYNFEGYVELKS